MYKKGDPISAQYQVKTNDIVYKWEPLPFSCRPKYGQKDTFNLGELGVTYFFNDETKIRFSFQNGRLLTPYMDVHNKGNPYTYSTTITFDTTNFNITSVSLTPSPIPKDKQGKKLTQQTFDLISYTYKFNEVQNKYTKTSQIIVTIVTLLFSGAIAAISLINIEKKSKNK